MGLDAPKTKMFYESESFKHYVEVNQRFAGQLSVCESTIDSNKNFNNYRSTLARITPPCVPFIGRKSSHVKDLGPDFVTRNLSHYTHFY